MLAFGVVGLFLPVWPTTPFVLVASICFASNPALHARIMKIPFVGEYIRNYKERKGISKKTMVVSLIFLWAMLTLSALYIGRPSIMILLAIIGMAVTIHIVYVSRPYGFRKTQNSVLSKKTSEQNISQDN